MTLGQILSVNGVGTTIYTIPTGGAGNYLAQAQFPFDPITNVSCSVSQNGTTVYTSPLIPSSPYSMYSTNNGTISEYLFGQFLNSTINLSCNDGDEISFTVSSSSTDPTVLSSINSNLFIQAAS